MKPGAIQVMDLLEPLTRPLWVVMSMPLSIGDVLGLVTGLLCVWLTTRASIWNFPAGIINSAILGLVFLPQRLFADASLQIVFIVLSILGWQQWHTLKKRLNNNPIVHSSFKQQQQLAIAAAVLTAVLTLLLHWAKGSVPLMDATITALSLCAQWQLNRRQLENWLWWIAVDVISIPVYWSRGLPLIALLYVVFLLLCIKGWFEWRRQRLNDLRVSLA